MTTESKQQSLTIKRALLGCGLLSVLLLIVLFLVFQQYLRPLFITIGPDERGVVISPHETTGYLEEPLTPGNRVIRLGESVEIYKITKETYSSSKDSNCCLEGSGTAIVLTIDGITLNANYQIVFGVDAKQVIMLHNNWKHHYKNNFVIPHSKVIVEEVASGFTSGEIALYKKEEIEELIFAKLKQNFSEEGLLLLDFKFEDISINE